MSIPVRSSDPRGPALQTQADAPRHPDPIEEPWAVPKVLSSLLAATDPPERERAWGRFLQAYSELLLRSARGLGIRYDGVMDRYAYLLEQLREADFRRLRRFRPTESARFTTWLAVVARRLCLDHRRTRYGRRRSTGGTAQEQARVARRRLADLLGEPVEVTELADAQGVDPEAMLAAAERGRKLEAVLAGLDPRSLLLLKLRFSNGMCAREIAEVLGYPTQFHVFRQLNGVLGGIREALLDAGVDDSGL